MVGDPKSVDPTDTKTQVVRHSGVMLTDARRAVKDASEHLREQIRRTLTLKNDNNEREVMKNLMAEDPGSVARLLLRDPREASAVCKLANEVTLKKAKVETKEKLFMYVGLVAGGVAIATGIGAGIGAATIVGVVTSSAVTATEVYHHSQRQKYFTKKSEYTRNSLLTGTGDKNTLSEMRKAREMAEEEGSSLLWTSGLGLLDPIGVLPAAKMGKAARELFLAKRSAQLAGGIANNAKQERVLIDMISTYRGETAHAILKGIDELPDSEKALFLKQLEGWKSTKDDFLDFVTAETSKIKRISDPIAKLQQKIGKTIVREMISNSKLGDLERKIKAREILSTFMDEKSITDQLLDGVLKAHHSHKKEVGQLSIKELREVTELLKTAGINDPAARRALIRRGIAGHPPRDEFDSGASILAKFLDEAPSVKTDTNIVTEESLLKRLTEQEERLTRLRSSNSASPMERVSAREDIESTKKAIATFEAPRNKELLDTIIGNNPTVAVHGRTGFESSDFVLSASREKKLLQEGISPLEMIIDLPKQDDIILFEISTGKPQRGRYLGRDPNNASEAIVEVFDSAKGGYKKVSLSFDDIAVSQKEKETMLKVITEQERKASPGLDAILEATTEQAGDRKFREMVHNIARNPYADEIAEKKEEINRLRERLKGRGMW